LLTLFRLIGKYLALGCTATVQWLANNTLGV
jgi:hypothetical protein